MGKVFIHDTWLSDSEFRHWRVEHGYESYTNYKEVLRKIPQLSAKTLNTCIRMLQADMSHPAFYGPDADEQEQFRHQTLLELMHAERGYRLVR